MFYVIEASLYKDADKEDIGMYPQATRDEAVGLFHQKMGGAMRNDKFLSEKLMVVDEQFAVVDNEIWQRVVEPTPEPEDTENE